MYTDLTLQMLSRDEPSPFRRKSLQQTTMESMYFLTEGQISWDIVFYINVVNQRENRIVTEVVWSGHTNFRNIVNECTKIFDMLNNNSHYCSKGDCQQLQKFLLSIFNNKSIFWVLHLISKKIKDISKYSQYYYFSCIK